MLVPQATTGAMQRIYRRDHDLVVWWATEIECVSALARLERRRDLTSRAAVTALRRLDTLREDWTEVQPLDSVRGIATRVLRTHDLRAADAVQLAAALFASEGRPASLEIVTLDSRLASAAEREGLVVVGTEPT